MKYTINFNKLLLFGPASLALLILLTITLSLCPTLVQWVNATENDSYYQDKATANINTTVGPMIAISLENQVDMSITPESTGVKETTNNAKLTIKTNNDSGYSIYMTSTNDGKLVNMDGQEKQAINSLPATGALTANTWGYKISKTGQPTPADYNAVPAMIERIHSSSSTDTTNEDDYELTFGVAVNTDLPTGYYQGSVTISAVTNPVNITSLRQLTYMQDMTSEICANTPFDEQGTMDPTQANPNQPITKQLIDQRDGKKYWVAKLRDGNCWMVQNLDINLDEHTTLTSADTDLPSGESYTFQRQGNESFYGQQSSILLATPTMNKQCDPIKSQESLYPTCLDSGFISIAEQEGETDIWSPTYTAQHGSVNLNNTYNGFVAANETQKTYDAHYLVGGLYSFDAATATNKGTICPKGWTLPTGNTTNNGSLANLLAAYGITNTPYATASTPSINMRDGTKVSYNVQTGEFDIAKEPLHLVRSGGANSYAVNSYAYLAGAGVSGNYWTKTSSSTEYAYYVSFSSTNVSANNSLRFYALSVRCLAQ